MDPAMNYQSINMPTNASSEDHSRRTVGLVLSSLPRAPTGSEGRVASTASDAHSRHLAVSPQSFTARSLLVGILIGVLITFSNTYFGLQTGWISTMAMPSALIGFSVFKVFSKHLSYPFTPIENVLIQTVAGAVGTMPLGCGFVGVIPAMEFLLKKGDDGPSGDGGTGEGGPLKLNVWKLMLWSLGVCLFGVVFAVPLRKETIIREKLKFPSGTASALMLRVLHGKGHEVPVAGGVRHSDSDLQEVEAPPPPYDTDESGPLLKDVIEDHAEKDDWRFKMRLLIGAFVVSGVYVRSSSLTWFSRIDNSRLSFPTLCRKFVPFLSSEHRWRTIGCGRLIHHQRTLGKALSWGLPHVCTCSLGPCWGGASYHHWQRPVAGPLEM